MYATDGSNYRQIPIGLVIPRDADDVVAAVARQNSIPVRIGSIFVTEQSAMAQFSANGEQLKVMMEFAGWRIVGYLGSGGEIVAMVEAA